MDILFDEAVQKHDMSLEQFAAIIATNPADRFDVYNKGRIAVGEDADFVFIKPNSPYTLKVEYLEYKNKISPYIAREIGSQMARTILHGETIYDLENGVVDTHPG